MHVPAATKWKRNHFSNGSKKRSNPIRNRFFIEGLHATGDIIDFSSGDARKLAAVLRKKSGDIVEVIDSAAHAFHARLQVESDGVSAKLLESLEQPVPHASLRVTVAQGIPKAQKMDFVIEKLTELGVDAVVPFSSERSVVDNVGENKIQRWRRIAKSAAQQCGRRDIPTIKAPVRWNQLVDQFWQYDRTLLPWELAPQAALRRRLPALLKGVSRMLIVIGPEGGFSHHEVDQARQHGAKLISLGGRILRTESAALALCSIVNYLTGTP